MSMFKAPLFVAGVVFSLIAIMHLVRIIQGTAMVFGATMLPMSASYIALIVFAALAVWMFASLSCCCRHVCTSDKTRDFDRTRDRDFDKTEEYDKTRDVRR